MTAPLPPLMYKRTAPPLCVFYVINDSVLGEWRIPQACVREMYYAPKKVVSMGILGIYVSENQ